MPDNSDKSNIISEFISLIGDPRVPILSKLLFGVLLTIYVVSPLDLIPEVFVPLGFVDDSGAIIGGIYLFVQYAKSQIERYGEMSEIEKQKYGQLPNQSFGYPSIAFGCFAIVGAGLLVVATGILVLLLSGFMSINGLFASIGDLLGEPATAQVTSSRTIVSSIQPLGQLVSVRSEVAQADINVSIDSGGMNLCNHDANHVAQGAVEAGVDITQISEDSITYDDVTDTYTIVLPPPAITSCRIEYIRQYERSGGNPTCGYDWDNVRLLAQYESTILFAEETIEANILSRAEREATLALESFIGSLTGSNIEIIYEEIEGEPTLPPSCEPQLPNGWIFDAELNAWVETP